jgi:hypothetical protein
MKSVTTIKNTPDTASWMDVIKQYSMPDEKTSWWQIINSVVPYVLLWVAMYYSLSVSFILLHYSYRFLRQASWYVFLSFFTIVDMVLSLSLKS